MKSSSTVRRRLDGTVFLLGMLVANEWGLLKAVDREGHSPERGVTWRAPFAVAKTVCRRLEAETSDLTKLSTVLGKVFGGAVQNSLGGNPTMSANAVRKRRIFRLNQ